MIPDALCSIINCLSEIILVSCYRFQQRKSFTSSEICSNYDPSSVVGLGGRDNSGRGSKSARLRGVCAESCFTWTGCSGCGRDGCLGGRLAAGAVTFGKAYVIENAESPFGKAYVIENVESPGVECFGPLRARPSTTSPFDDVGSPPFHRVTDPADILVRRADCCAVLRRTGNGRVGRRGLGQVSVAVALDCKAGQARRLLSKSGPRAGGTRL